MSTLRHGERRPNPSNPKGLGVNKDSPRIPHGRGEDLLEERAKEKKEPRDRAKNTAAAAGGREKKKGSGGCEEIRQRKLQRAAEIWQ